ncbi:MAG: LptA/OstA family protein [Francisellaceae bacterium]
MKKIKKWDHGVKVVLVIRVKALWAVLLALLLFPIYGIAAEDGDMNAAKLFGDNSTSDGPITICSDTLSYSQENHKLIYQGDVLVMQTKGANILCDNHPIAGLDTSLPEYSFEKSNVADDYADKQKMALALAKEICERQKGCRFMSGQTLTLTFTEDNEQIETVNLSTTDNYTAKYYSLPSVSGKAQESQPSKSDDEETYAQGQDMNFNFSKHLLTITNNAFIDRGGNKFSGEKVLYDTKTKLVTVPNTGQRATVILNNLPQNKDEKK